MTGRWLPHAACAIAAGLLPGCWAAPAMVETESIGADKPAPRGPAPTPPGGPGAGTTPTGSQGGADPAPPRVGPLTEPTFTPSAAVRSTLPGGIAVVVGGQEEAGAPRTANTALIRLTVRAGNRDGAPGLAHLAARSLVHAPSGASDHPPLSEALERMGGTVGVRVGSQTTSFDILVPQPQWAEALQALIAGITDPPTDAKGIENARSSILQRARTDLGTPSTDHLVDLVTRASGTSGRELLRGLEDRVAEEIGPFIRASYRPGGAVVSLWLPGADADKAVERVGVAALPWTGPDAPTGETTPLAKLELGSRLYWAARENARPGLALVIELPDLDEPDALERLVLLECITMGGVGGRLQRAVAAKRPVTAAMHSRVQHDGNARYLVLSAQAPPEAARDFWGAWVAARRSVQRDPPRGAELTTAAARARLLLLHEHADPGLWLEAATGRALRGGEPASLQSALAKLADPGALELAAAAAALGRAPSALVVLGDAPRADEELPSSELPASELVDAFPGAETTDLPLRTREQITAANDFLDAAASAVGERRVLKKLRGLAARRTIRAEGAVAADEVLWVGVDRMRRLRRVLGTTIETVAGPEGGLERAATDKVELAEEEVRDQLAGAHRHPLLLLAAWARGEARFRLVSVRMIGDREMAVLERIGPAWQSIRILMDTESFLIRQVHARRWARDEQRLVWITESWEDYRRADGLRCPFLGHVAGHDGLAREVSWVSVRLGEPAAECLQAGGPTEIQ